MERAENGWKPFSRMGFVLAGGRSSRMGSDKALLPYRGGALVESVAERVQQAAGSAVLVGHAAAYSHLRYPVIPDLYPGEGPLGGILTALAHSHADWNLIVACDMPNLTAPFLRDLFDRAASSGADVVMPAISEGRIQPLCAVYHIGAKPTLTRSFDAGTRKVILALEEVRVLRVDIPETALFHNVNTPKDWADYAGH